MFSERVFKPFRKGLKLGLLLQIAIGPIGLFLLQLGLIAPAHVSLSAVAGVTLGDALFIVLAFLGVGTLLNHASAAKKRVMGYMGGLMIVLFGAYFMFVSFSPVGTTNALADHTSFSAFYTTFFLTISSPLTILFWTGLFSNTVAQEGFSPEQMKAFALGALLTTPFYMSLLVLGASVIAPLFTPTVIALSTFLIGATLLLIGTRTVFKTAQS